MYIATLGQITSTTHSTIHPDSIPSNAACCNTNTHTHTHTHAVAELWVRVTACLSWSHLFHVMLHPRGHPKHVLLHKEVDFCAVHTNAVEAKRCGNERFSPRTHLPLEIAQHVVGDFKDDRPLAPRDRFDDVAAVAGKVEERAALPFAERFLDLFL